MKLDWKPDKFKEEIKAKLVANAEIVGKFVEEDARRRLLAIKYPERGSAYRQQYVAREITHEVEALPNEVVISVGLPPGKRRQTGGFTRHVGFYIEMGSATWPANPYLRPSVFSNAKHILALLRGD